MTRREALQILGLTEEVPQSELKTTYRKLIQQVHPDADLYRKENYAYSAAEINAAYSFLISDQMTSLSGSEKPEYRKAEAANKSEKKNADSGSRTKTRLWHAAQNPNAFFPRTIFGEAEDAEGQVIGLFSIARGRYYWSKEEAFPLFMRSIRLCSEEILDSVDRKLKRPRNRDSFSDIQARLSFLLAQQMIDAEESLPWLCRDVTGEFKGEAGVAYYQVQAMLKRHPAEKTVIKVGEMLLPAGQMRNRIYVRSLSGINLGHLSFADDRLYYVLIPLIRQKRIQVKMLVSGVEQDHIKIRFLIRYEKTLRQTMPEDLNGQIRDCLREYAGL